MYPRKYSDTNILDSYKQSLHTHVKEPKGSTLPAFWAQQSEATILPLLAVYPGNQQVTVYILSTPIRSFS